MAQSTNFKCTSLVRTNAQQKGNDHVVSCLLLPRLGGPGQWLLTGHWWCPLGSCAPNLAALFTSVEGSIRSELGGPYPPRSG